MQWLPKMKVVKRKKTIIIALVLALVLVTAFTARCYSYLVSVRSAEIEVSTAPQQNVLRLSGSFDLERWVSSGETGYCLTNLGDEDLWVYFEYTGDLGQVFGAVPVLIPRKGGEQPNTVSLKLAPLDDISSPRVLNPQDVFTSDDSGKDFSGTIKIYTLNKYVALETDRINVPGEALWQVMVAKKFATEDGAKAVDAIAGTDAGESLKNVDATWSDNEDVGAKAFHTIAADEEYVTLVKEHKGITLKDRVVFIVERVAPGLMDEHKFLTEATESLVKRFDRLTQIVQQMVKERDTLQQTVNAQAERIQALESENTSLTQQVKELQEKLSALTAALSASSAGNAELGNSVTSPTNEGEKAEAESRDTVTEPPVAGQEQAVDGQGAPASDAGAGTDTNVPVAPPSAED